MHTSKECITCFYKQAHYALGLTNVSLGKKEQILTEVKQLIENFDHSLSPPVNSMAMYETIARHTGSPDLFKELKELGNKQALQARKQVKDLIDSAEDPLFAAIQFAIAGNIIDYGSHQEFDLETTLKECMDKQLAMNDYQSFSHELTNASSILYLADNCGEIVFDSLLIELLPATTILSVKEGAILNDALIEDAYFCGLDRHCQIITNGTSCPGTPLEQCSKEFLEKFEQADIVISKGQGNFETLSQTERPIYFLLTIKCPVVAQHVKETTKTNNAINVGDAVFLKS